MRDESACGPPRILVTGAMGYVGTELIDRLLRDGCWVVGLDRQMRNTHAIRPHPRLALFRGDVRDVSSLGYPRGTFDAVVHLAFASNDPKYELSPCVAQSVNLDGTAAAIDYAARNDIRKFVFMSSCSVYGNTKHSEVDEASELCPLTDYASHKATCERLIEDAAAGQMIDCFLLRAATLCGVSGQPRFDLLLNQMLFSASKNGELVIEGPSRNRPILPLPALIKIISALLLRSDRRVVERTIRLNLAFENATVLEWASLVQSISGARLNIVPDGGIDKRSYVVNSGRARQLIGTLSIPSVEATARILFERLRANAYEGEVSDPRWCNLTAQKSHDFQVRRSPERVC